jgi:hypothetical protein
VRKLGVIHKKVGHDFPGETFRVLKEKKWVKIWNSQPYHYKDHPFAKWGFFGVRNDYFDNGAFERRLNFKQRTVRGRIFWGIEIPIGTLIIQEFKEPSPIATAMNLIQYFASPGMA